MNCTNCGEKVPDSALVCGNCGHRLKDAPPPKADKIDSTAAQKDPAPSTPSTPPEASTLSTSTSTTTLSPPNPLGGIAVLAVLVFVFIGNPVGNSSAPTSSGVLDQSEQQSQADQPTSSVGQNQPESEIPSKQSALPHIVTSADSIHCSYVLVWLN